METVTAILHNYAPRQLTGRNGLFTLHEIETSAGTYRIRADMVPTVTQLIGAQVEMVTRVEQKGDFTNYIADHVSISERQPNATAQIMGAQQAQAQRGQQQPQQSQQVMPRQVTPQEKEISIHRQVAAKVAAKISTSPDEFWNNINDLFTYFQSGQVPSQAVQDYAGNDIPY